MGVPCRGCGREYDVTLFGFGRTFHCTCGERVWLEPRVRELGDEGRPRFIADVMLGRLAHWLRMTGIDCAHEEEIEDEQLVRRAFEERRIILTRDKSLPEEWRIIGVYYVSAKMPIGQLREVVAEFKLAEAARPFSRCGRCNTPLLPTTSEQVQALSPDQVPYPVLRKHEKFWRCPDCERVYWEGSHTEQMREVIEHILEQQP